MTQVFTRHGLSVRAPVGWQDITDQLGEDPAPFTLAGPTGVGALQLSVGVQRSGPGTPRPTPQDVQQMVRELAAQRGLRLPLDERVELSPLLLATAAYAEQGAFIRLWMVFDGARFVAASYVCDAAARDLESGQAELVVRSARVTT